MEALLMPSLILAVVGFVGIVCVLECRRFLE